MPKNIKQDKNKTERVKTTILINKTLKKLAQVYALQSDMTLGELIEESLETRIIDK